MRSIINRAVTLFAVLAFLATSCMAAEESGVRLFWPAPPYSPQLEFIGIFHSQNSFEKTAWEKRLDILLGELKVEGIRFPTSILPFADDKVLVTERNGRNVMVFDFAQKKVYPLFRVGSALFNEPVDLALDNEGNLYVADRKKGVIGVFDSELKPAGVLGGEIGFESLEKIAIDNRHQIVYASDSALDKVFALNFDGELLFTVGGDKGIGSLRSPHGMALDAVGNLFVADTGNARIKVYNSRGQSLGVFAPGSKESGSVLIKPWDLAFDPTGVMHILDQGRAAILTCRMNGEILYLTGASHRTNHLLGFWRPSDISIAGDGRIFVADELNKRFSVWQLLTETYLAQNPIGPEDKSRLIAFLDDLKQKYNKKIRERSGTLFADKPASNDREEHGPVLRRLDGTPIATKQKLSDDQQKVGQRNMECPNCDT